MGQLKYKSVSQMPSLLAAPPILVAPVWQQLIDSRDCPVPVTSMPRGIKQREAAVITLVCMVESLPGIPELLSDPARCSLAHCLHRGYPVTQWRQLSRVFKHLLAPWDPQMQRLGVRETSKLRYPPGRTGWKPMVSLRGGGSRIPPEYDLVSVYEVDHNGDYVSHDIMHHQRRRRRRAAAQPGGDALHLQLKGPRHDLHLDLRAASDLVAPGFMVQTLGKGGTTSVQVLTPEEFCFYQGSLRSQGKSSVALSTCQGLLGMIRTKDADYFLKPLPPHLSGKPSGSAQAASPSHVLYKRSTEPQALRENEVLLVTRKRDLARSHLHHGNFHLGLPQKQHFCGRRKKYMPQPPKEDLYILPDEYKPSSRHKRSLLKSHRNEELNVETLVVVDRKMMENHGHGNVTTYVLTVLNMVSALFKDGTIGGNINIAIVGLILLEEEQPGLAISHHADHTLSRFCQWQSGLMGKDGTRHDHAILLTGLDICSWKNEPCDTLGFAPISGMCSKYRSCTINEDSGLGLAFTIAHESGHNFGMVHDGEGNMCKKSEGNIMSPTLAGRNGVFSWSSCSRQYLHKFLSTAQAICLADQPKPVKEYKYPEKLPGQLYDANTQCKWQFGEKAKLCMLDFRKAILLLQAAALCSQELRKISVRPCGAIGLEGSVKRSSCQQQRAPSVGRTWPSHGGKFCQGSARTLKLCNREKCPPDSVDFRAAQCAEYNSKHFRGWLYKWKPYTRVEEYYHIVTIPPGARSIRIYETNISTSYISVRNSLKKYYLNGHWSVDWPGRYKFSGTAFNYRRSYKEPESLTSTGPTNETLIVELLFQGRNPGVAWEFSLPRSNDKKTPAVQPSYTWAIIRSQCSVSCGGACTLQSPGLQLSRLPTRLEHRALGRGNQCSRTCGKGWRKRTVACKSTNPSARAQLLHDAACTSEPKPRTHEVCLLKRCHKHKKLQWLVSAWSQCSVTCERGTQQRVLRCAEKYVSGKYRELVSKKCLHLPKPDLELERACALFPCPKNLPYSAAGPQRGSWFASPWSQCTASCGGGVQRRTVQCLLGGQPASDCFLHQKPETSSACNTHFCPIAEKRETFCQDLFHWCYLVPHHGMCSHRFYSKQCCNTCSRSNL
ncbi:A disintegrin and metalloproteinase with thrombospondin motifs 16 [Microtus ochrogaster]|uniref:A disintegrin and metalloproteinase with thrombospondin motifs 16 n=1 Tax=Microtus ochrogaster TaxID=79684 RepID=A0A8J6L5N3_MICOH|nr:A disintegrin and metalloproteinase with thrombospondin motifs 16 [Microtus ochrogaster]